MRKKNLSGHSIWEIILPLAAIYAIIALFQDDSGKIVSNRGALVLEDEKMMKRISQKIEQTKKENKNPEHISVSLD
jgi:hypothetical protein